MASSTQREAGVAARTLASTSTSTDVSELLSLKSAPARFILGLFILSNVAFTVATLDRMSAVWPSAVALVLISTGALLIMRPQTDPFPIRDTIILLGIVVSSALTVSWYLPEVGDLGRESWHLGAATWLLFFLALRRRALMAWLGMALLTSITVWWAVSTGRGAPYALTMVQMHIGILLVATLFASSLRRTARTINTLTARSVDAAAAAAGAYAGSEIRSQRVAELAALAVPPLELIATGHALSGKDRNECRTVEAELRDSVRGRSLSVPSITAAVRSARSRGVAVNLLDDRGTPLPSGSAMQRLQEQVVASLDATTTGTVTVRMLPEGRDAAVTVVAGDPEAPQRYALNQEGEPFTA